MFTDRNTHTRNYKVGKQKKSLPKKTICKCYCLSYMIKMLKLNIYANSLKHLRVLIIIHIGMIIEVFVNLYIHKMTFAEVSLCKQNILFMTSHSLDIFLCWLKARHLAINWVFRYNKTGKCHVVFTNVACIIPSRNNLILFSF